MRDVLLTTDSGGLPEPDKARSRASGAVPAEPVTPSAGPRPEQRQATEAHGAQTAPDPLSESERAAAVLGSIRAGIAQLRGLELWRVPELDLLDIARIVETAGRSLAGVAVRITGEFVERGTADTLGARSPAAMLHEALNTTHGQARGRVRLVTATLPCETPSGDTLQPPLPQVLAALDDGTIAEDQAVVIVDTMRAVPAGVDEGTRAQCLDLLLVQAGIGDVLRLKRVADQVRLIVDPDGKLSGKDATARQELHIGQLRRDGLTPIRGTLDQLTVEALRQAIEPLAEPRPIDDKTPDPRSAPLRRAQALGEVLARYLATGKGPIDGGVRPQVVVTIPLERLLDATGAGWADYTGPIDAATARMLACDAEIIPQVLGSESVVLDQGRAVRLFPPEIRRAIATRDRGCAFPDCDIPAAWCEGHHVLWWKRDLGPTSERNGCLLCRQHHTQIHHGDWLIRMPEQGRPEIIPPPWVDPSQSPRVNHYWDSPLLAG